MAHSFFFLIFISYQSTNSTTTFADTSNQPITQWLGQMQALLQQRFNGECLILCVIARRFRLLNSTLPYNIYRFADNRKFYPPELSALAFEIDQAAHLVRCVETLVCNRACCIR
jgi:hypothetical protein